MDTLRFKRLTQMVGNSSRRIALRGAIGGTFMATAATLATTTGGAKKKCKKKKCPKCEALAIGESCTSTSQCCGTETNLACAFANGGDTLACCGTAGAACANGAQCCDNFDCNDGTCGPPL
jgi:hypothetical protein